MAKSKKPGETWKGHVSSEVKTAYNRRTYQSVTFRMKLDGSDGITADDIRASAEATGQSVNAWIIEALKAYR